MKKTSDAAKRQLKNIWKRACNGYLVELLRMWELDGNYSYWVGEDVGGVLVYGDGIFSINMDDIIYCVENDVTEAQYLEWQDYICDASLFDFDTPNFKSWMHGCPRTGKKTFAMLRALRADLETAINNEKERLKNGKIHK